MIKLTFEGEHLAEVLGEMKNFINDATEDYPKASGFGSPWIPPGETAPDKPLPKGAIGRKPIPKKPAGKTPPVKSPKAPAPEARAPAPEARAPEPVPEPVPEQQLGLSFELEEFDEPAPAPEPETIDPVMLSAIRIKTTEDLQAAYSSGKHKQVLALLAKYGNGAKSFRELQIKDFVPIRKAIDEGALA